MANKYLDVDIELEDVEEFVQSASIEDLLAIKEWLNERRRQLNEKEGPDLFETERALICQSRTALQQLACQELQELITRLGPEEIVDRLNAS